jgi:hypothetical protein
MANYELRTNEGVEAVEVLSAGPLSRGAGLTHANFSECPGWLEDAMEKRVLHLKNSHAGLRLVLRGGLVDRGDFLVLRNGEIEHWPRARFKRTYQEA